VGARAQYPGPQDKLGAYEAVVATQPDLPRRGARNPYTSLNGTMTSFLDATGSMGLRLSAADREEFLAHYDSGPAEQYGRTMREFVVVPDALLVDTAALTPWFARSVAWVATLPPKPTKR
jgi:hypothetical protein